MEQTGKRINYLSPTAVYNRACDAYDVAPISSWQNGLKAGAAASTLAGVVAALGKGDQPLAPRVIVGVAALGLVTFVVVVLVLEAVRLRACRTSLKEMLGVDQDLEERVRQLELEVKSQTARADDAEQQLSQVVDSRMTRSLSEAMRRRR